MARKFTDNSAINLLLLR